MLHLPATIGVSSVLCGYNNSSSVWGSSMHQHNLHDCVHICPRDISNIAKEHRSRSRKFNGKNWRDDLPSCGCRVGPRMSSDCCTWSVYRSAIHRSNMCFVASF
uniref:Uncharacterized protein n=1 Tax=Opuntia streptacantha TaxID=393608 RepID=A0A7C9AME7_OPUST